MIQKDESILHGLALILSAVRKKQENNRGVLSITVLAENFYSSCGLVYNSSAFTRHREENPSTVICLSTFDH